MDYSDDKPFISGDDYKFLKKICDKSKVVYPSGCSLPKRAPTVWKIINKNIADTISAFNTGILFNMIIDCLLLLDKELIPIAKNVPKMVEMVVDSKVMVKVTVTASLKPFWVNIASYHLVIDGKYTGQEPSEE